MLWTIISGAMGFAAPFLPDAIKLVQGWRDDRHELRLIKLQAEIAAQEQAHRMDVMGMASAGADRHSARRMQSSFGVDLLQAAATLPMGQLPKWAFAAGWVGYSMVDWVRGMVRPAIAVALFLTYAYVKATIYVDSGNIETLWTEYDYSLLTTVVTFYFGSRAREKALKQTP